MQASRNSHRKGPFAICGWARSLSTTYLRYVCKVSLPCLRSCSVINRKRTKVFSNIFILWLTDRILSFALIEIHPRKYTPQRGKVATLLAWPGVLTIWQPPMSPLTTSSQRDGLSPAIITVHIVLFRLRRFLIQLLGNQARKNSQAKQSSRGSLLRRRLHLLMTRNHEHRLNTTGHFNIKTVFPYKDSRGIVVSLSDFSCW